MFWMESLFIFIFYKDILIRLKSCIHFQDKGNFIVSLWFYLSLTEAYPCNKSRSRDYSTQSLIIVSLTLSLAKTQDSQSLAKTQGSVRIRPYNTTFHVVLIYSYTGISNWPDWPVRFNIEIDKTYIDNMDNKDRTNHYNRKCYIPKHEHFKN